MSLTLPADIFEPIAFRSELHSGAGTGKYVPLYKAAMERTRRHLDEAFQRGDNIRTLVQARALVVDELLRCAWEHQAWPDQQLSLIAVGGYGRGELHPYSDIDLLILLPANDDHRYSAAIESFITFLWTSIYKSAIACARLRSAAKPLPPISRSPPI